MDEADQPIGELTWETSGVQIEAIGPVLTRFLPESSIAGRITSIATLDWQQDAARVEVKLLSRDCTFHSPFVLSGEKLSMQRGNLELRATSNGDEWKVEKLRFDSDFAEFELTALGRNLLKSNPTHVEKFPVFFEKVVAQGKLDLPRIATEVPSALRLREHTKIDSGQVQFSVQLASSEKGREWKADVTASQLAATADGRILRWEQPIVVKLQMQQSLSGDWKGDVACVSDYLEVKANGSPEAGTVCGDCRLNATRRGPRTTC